MGCLLRVAGQSFDPVAFLKNSTLSSDRMWRKGEPRAGNVREKLHQDYGFNVVVSNADPTEFETQTRDAIAFLKGKNSELKRLGSIPGVELVLDFDRSWTADMAMTTSRLPLELIALCADVHAAIEISTYAVADS